MRRVTTASICLLKCVPRRCFRRLCTDRKSCPRALRFSTIDGARALGLDSEIGSLEVGKRADVAVVRLERLHTTPVKDVVSALVYSTEVDDVATVIIDGRLVMRDRKLLTIDEGETTSAAKSEAEKLIETADLK